MYYGKRPLFIVYPAIAASHGDASVIAPDFHRYVATQRLTELLRRLGDVIGIDGIQDVDILADKALAGGQQVLFICFSQPQWLPEGIRCKTVAAFAWPYETIPTQSWGDYPRHDWRVALNGCAGAVTFSRHAADSIAQAMGPQFPLHAINPMLEAGCADASSARKTGEWHIDIRGVVFDSQALGFDRATQAPLPDFAPQASCIHLHGTVYTAVLDPIDDAKNWLDALYGFGIAFRDNPHVTLVLKLCNPDTPRVCHTVSHWLQKLVPIKCRVLVIVAHLTPAQYSALVRNSSFYLSTAHAHGKAMAMLEFMAAGVPVIAPRHTATAGILDDGNSFAIECSREWTWWPHDARQRLTTYRYRIVWESVRQQLLHSLQVITTNQALYQQMAVQARSSGIAHSSPDIAAFTAWLAGLGITTSPKKMPAMPFGDKLGVQRRLHGLLQRILDFRSKRK